MQRILFLSRLLFSAAAALAVLTAQPAGIYTAEQAQSGRAIYDRNCSACHGVDFEGSGDAPALAGGTFMLKWRPKMVSELFGLILQTMPPTNPGSLGEAAALNATAYILQRNGAQAGEQALAASTATLITAVATGQTPANGQARAGGRGGAAGADDGAPRGRGPATLALGAGTTAGQGRGGASARRG